jgi:hypothetical protein
MSKWELLSKRLAWAVDRKLQTEPGLTKITNVKLAEIAGVSPPAVGYWYADANGMEAEQARRLAVFLDVDPVWLEKGEGEPLLSTINRQPDNTVSAEEVCALISLFGKSTAAGRQQILDLAHVVQKIGRD